MVHPVAEVGAHLEVHDVSVRGGGPDLVHHGRHKVVSLKLLGAELCAALRAAHRAVASPPVPGDTGFAEVMHAGQHNRLPKQVTADDTCQVFFQAASGRGGTNSSSSSSSHDGQSPLKISQSTRRKRKQNPEETEKQLNWNVIQWNVLHIIEQQLPVLCNYTMLFTR